MANFSDFLAYIRIEAPGCPESLLEQAVLNACIKFCEKTLTWRIEHSPINIVADTKEYALVTGDAAISVVTVIEPIKCNGEKVYQTTKSRLNQDSDKWDEETGTKAAAYLVSKEPWQLRPVPYPSEDVAGGIVLTIAVKPSRAATTVPDFLLEDNLEAINAGALGSLLVMPEKKWSNPSLGAHYQSLFNEAVDDEKGNVKREHKKEDRRNRSKGQYF